MCLETELGTSCTGTTDVAENLSTNQTCLCDLAERSKTYGHMSVLYGKHSLSIESVPVPIIQIFFTAAFCEAFVPHGLRIGIILQFCTSRLKNMYIF